MEIFHIHWRSYDKKNKHVVGFLIYDERWYFKYNNNEIMEAIESGFRPFPDMPEISKIYVSEHLFPVFNIRYSRSDSKELLSFMKNNAGDLVTDNVLIAYVEKDKERIR